MMQCVARRSTGLFAQIQLQVGILLAHSRQQFRQKEWRDCRDNAHSQVASKRLPGRTRHLGKLLGFAQYAVCLGHNFAAERRKPDYATGALDQH